MKTIINALLLTVAPVIVMAAGNSIPLERAPVDVTDQASLQHGAKLFVNYCQGCHSLDYMRYNRMAEDIGLTKEETEDNLIFTLDDEGTPTKFGSLMFSNMSKKYGMQVYGLVPPNLSLTARSRGADWIYTYLNSFYLDDSRPLGVNNTLFKDVGMPHALWELQGWQKANYVTRENKTGEKQQVIEYLSQSTEGTLSPAEYKAATADLTNFLVYTAEPIQEKRRTVGKWVLLFLIVFTFLAYLLKKEYWKDVH